MVRVSVAPGESELLVLIETRGKPMVAPHVFGLDIDFAGSSAWDATVRFGPGGGALATSFPETGPPVRQKLDRFECAAADAVEARIPLAQLAAELDEGEADAWARGDRRSFVRVQFWTAAGDTTERIDEGPAAASFRLVAPPFDLDAPVARDASPRRAVRPPLEGKWFVRQGPDGIWSHRGLFAYDLAIEDHALRPTATTGSRRLEDYLSFGLPVVAPEAGSVAFVSQESEDRAPLERSAGRDSGNTLIVRLADGLRLSFGHLRKGSVRLERGAEFEAGARLGEVGNSGDSGAPHLHLSMHERPGEFVGLPIAFKDVRVGLNPGPDDPWARDLPAWTVREGWFFEKR